MLNCTQSFVTCVAEELLLKKNREKYICFFLKFAYLIFKNTFNLYSYSDIDIFTQTD